jgi:hypothetical protein
MSSIHRVLAGLLSLALPLLAPGCTPKAGDSCHAGETRCHDKSSAFECVSGKLAAIPCDGPAGCSESGDVTTCDFRNAAEGAPCFAPGDATKACGADAKSMAQCADGKVHRRSCSGRGGCSGSGATTLCATAIAPGEPCMSFDRDYLCTDSGDSYVTCAEGKYTTVSMCRGPLRCRPFDTTVACDTALGQAGDACLGGQSCAADGKTLLTCGDDHKLAATAKCLGPNGCTVLHGINRDCDDSIAEVGGSCTPMSHSCTADGASLLECKEGAFAVSKACAKGTKCDVNGITPKCR